MGPIRIAVEMGILLAPLKGTLIPILDPSRYVTTDPVPPTYRSDGPLTRLAYIRDTTDTIPSSLTTILILPFHENPLPMAGHEPSMEAPSKLLVSKVSPLSYHIFILAPQLLSHRLPPSRPIDCTTVAQREKNSMSTITELRRTKAYEWRK